jgi:hypothetical protein
MSGKARALTAAWCRVVVLVALALGSTVLPALAEHDDHWSSTPYRLLPDSSLRGPPDEYVIGGDDEPAPSVRDWVGLGRDTGFLIGYQILGAAILYALPESASRWSDSHKEIDAGKWWENVQSPTWDSDRWAVNYIGHPYFGAAYYIRARERGFNPFESFLYSTVASTIYEFGVEAFFEPPSYQDLIVTPIGGSLLGGFVFEPLRNWIRQKPERKWYDYVGLVATDPIGALNVFLERLLGIKSHIRVAIPREGGVRVEVRVPWK